VDEQEEEEEEEEEEVGSDDEVEQQEEEGVSSPGGWMETGGRWELACCSGCPCACTACSCRCLCNLSMLSFPLLTKPQYPLLLLPGPQGALASQAASACSLGRQMPELHSWQRTAMRALSWRQ
jgi:hypothetical protein